MPPCSISAAGKQRDHRCSFLCRSPGFRYPQGDPPAVRRVHPTNATPGLRQAVLGRTIERGALGIFGDGADIQCKMEFPVKFIEKILWSFPKICAAREAHITRNGLRGLVRYG